MCASWPRRARLALRVVASLCVAAPLSGAAAESTEARRVFLQRHHCEVTTRLAMIRDTPVVKNKFLAISPDADRGAYVQCLFNEAGDQVYCEAASGYYRTPNGKTWVPDMPPAAVSALESLGFETKIEQGNFWQELAIKDGSDLDGVANLMLGALFDAYGVRLGLTLNINAPLVELEGPMPPTCTPSS